MAFRIKTVLTPYLERFFEEIDNERGGRRVKGAPIYKPFSKINYILRNEDAYLAIPP